MISNDSTFFHLGIAPNMLAVLQQKKFVTPTPIQAKAIPLALKGDDIVGIAQTGTGKTLAFGIPTIQRLAADGGRALVLVPTRELANQVDMVLVELLRSFKMNSAVLIGGVSMSLQKSALRKNPEILIATPGRLLDLMYQGLLDLGNVKILILDEADRMYDMGFAPQVDKILSCLPRERQSMLFSATMPPEIFKLATKHMKLPIHVEIAPSGTTIEEITQEVFIVREAVKKDLLRSLLQQYRGTILIFTRTKAKAARVTRSIREINEKVTEIHSNRTMSQRNAAMEGFKRGRFRILVATDIAARGIDISMIELVINYDLPDEIENYVHRIGRTGRAGRSGHAISFAKPDERIALERIERLIKKSLPRGSHKFVSSADHGHHESRRPAHVPHEKRGRRRRSHRSARRHSFSHGQAH